MTTQVADGVYVSSTDAEDYAADPEVGALAHTLREDAHVQAGVWKGPGFRECWVDFV